MGGSRREAKAQGPIRFSFEKRYVLRLVGL